MIIPAIDLIGGETVRLYQGDYGKKTRYQKTPLEIKASYAAQGAAVLHLVDLDGAKDSSARQLTLLKRLIDQQEANTDMLVQVGGGVRAKQDVQALLDIGADRVVIGSLAIKEPETVKQWMQEFGSDKIVLALDINIDEQGNKWLPTHGWIEKSNVTLESLLEDYQGVEVKHVLCTDISKDGTLSGSNVALYQELVTRYPDIQWQASGGIGSLADIEALKPTKVSGVILGKALLDGNFTLKEAIACWQDA